MAIYVNQTGLRFERTLRDPNGGPPINLSSYTTLEFLFIDPDGDCFTRDAAFVTNGNDGKLEYITVPGDLSEPGTWRIQPHVAKTGEDHFAEVTRFEVLPSLAC